MASGISWDSSYKDLFLFQKRLFKSVFIGDYKISLILQKLIFKSNFARLLAIREVTQISTYKGIPGIDGKVCLTFTERFQLNEFLKNHCNNWQFQNVKSISFILKEGTTLLNIPTISDRAWEVLVSFIITPVHEAIFHPRNLGFREGISHHLLQDLTLCNISKYSFGYEKRILLINLKGIFIYFDKNKLLSKILSPRGVKFGIFRCLNKGVLLSYDKNSFYFSWLFANIILDGIEKIHCCLRFGYDLLFFLKPFDNEKDILSKVYLFLTFLGLNYKYISFVKILKATDGFDLLDWRFYINNLNESICVPSFNNYQNFLRKIKPIINNSNYGFNVKVSKLQPLIKEWKSYHKNSILTSSRFSLFLIQKEMFKIFNKESRQDFYSVKKLTDKCFNVFSLFDNDLDLSNSNLGNSLYYKHVVFWFSFSSDLDKYFFSTRSKTKYFFICIFCGTKKVNDLNLIKDM